MPPMSAPSPHTLALERALAGVDACTRCPLCETRVNVVPGSGSPDAEVMFVGEAPGAAEDAAGEPFCGAAGKRLEAFLGVAGLSRDDVYIANILKCRPPKNRNPRPQEIRACTPWLTAQIAAVDPRVLVGLGNFATRFLLDTDEGITELRGRVHVPDSPTSPAASRPVLPMFHPAAAIYDPKKAPVLESDFRLLAQFLVS